LSAAGLDDLDASVRRNKPDHWLASRFIGDAGARADVIALYAFDHELSRAVAMKEPLIAEIRLTWWSEAMGEIFEGRPVRRHPVTLALQNAVEAHALPRDAFDAMIDARFDLIETPAHASERTEAALMALAIRVLGSDAPGAASAAAALRFGSGDGATASRAAHGLDLRAFPAIAYAALPPGAAEPALGRRLRLVWTILRGRF
jgi:phytoene synthase